MTKKNLPNSGITSDWDLGAPFKTDMDANLRRIDSLLMPRVKSRTTSAPPANPVEGDSYIVASGATGAWANQYPRLAVYLDGAWGFIDPKEGWEVRVLDENCRVYYTGAAWSSYSADVLSLLNAADKSAARTALGVPSLAGDTFTGPISAPGTVLGVTIGHAIGAETNYKLATLSGSNDETSYSHLLISGVLDDAWHGSGQTPFQLFIATRTAFTAQMVWYGAARTSARILVYLEADTTYTVWLRFTANSYTSAGLTLNAGACCTAYRDTPTGTPSGTLVYDSGDTVSYPPVAVLNFAADMRAFLACTNDAAARAELGLGSLSTTPDGNVEAQSYVKLGSDSPAIQMKEITGVTGSVQGYLTPVAHGLTGDKIISVEAVVRHWTNSGMPPEHTGTGGHQYSVSYDATNVYIRLSAANSELILSKPFSVLITYKQ